MKLTKKGPVTQLKEEYEKLQTELKMYQDTLLRTLADYENFRKRKDKEISEFRSFAHANLLLELLPVLDNFERAFSYIKKSSNENNNLLKGLEIAYRQLLEVLSKFGLKEFSCINQLYDPKLAEVIGCIEKCDVPENTVVEEINKGYYYRDRILRPARVIVAKLPQKQTSESNQEVLKKEGDLDSTN
jgi:molecular chaperone GrpE